MTNISQTNNYIRRKKWKKECKGLISAIFLAFLIFFMIHQIFFFYVNLKDNSMENTLPQGSKIYFKRIHNFFSSKKEIKELNIHRGQIIALNFKNKTRGNPSKSSYHFSKKLAQIISLGFFFKDTPQIIVRRIVGISGDTVEIYQKKLFVNQREIIPSWNIKKEDQSILSSILSDRDNTRKILVPKDSIFVLCDNWDVFSDSRTFGIFSYKQIVGTMY